MKGLAVSVRETLPSLWKHTLTQDCITQEVHLAPPSMPSGLLVKRQRQIHSFIILLFVLCVQVPLFLPLMRERSGCCCCCCCCCCCPPHLPESLSFVYSWLLSFILSSLIDFSVSEGASRRTILVPSGAHHSLTRFSAALT